MTIGRWALGVALASGCAPDRLEPRPASAPWPQTSPYVAAAKPTCGPPSIASVDLLLPNDTLVGMVAVDLASLQRSRLFRDNLKQLGSDAREALDVMKACGLPRSKMGRVVAGFSEASDVVVGIRAEGIATPETLDCLGRELERQPGRSAWTRTTHGCTTTLDIDGGEARGFAVGRDMLVVASKSMADAVRRRLSGATKPLLDGRLGWVRREVDTGKTIWMAGLLPTSLQAGLGGSMTGLRRVGVSLDVSSGVGLVLTTGFSSSLEAQAAKTEMDTLVGQARAMLPMLGLSATVADTVKLASKGTLVRLSMALSASDIEALRTFATGSVGGAPPEVEAPGEPPPLHRGI